MTVAARLRKLEAGVATVDRVDYAEGKPTMTVRYDGNATPEQRAATAAFVARAIALWPLLADLAEAAEKTRKAEDKLEHRPHVSETEHTRTEGWRFTDGTPYSEDEYQERLNTWEAERDRLDAALARVADHLDHEEGKT